MTRQFWSELPAAVTMRTDPPSAVVAGGGTALIVESLIIVTFVEANRPKRTAWVPVKPEPVMVAEPLPGESKFVPPPIGPSRGSTDETVRFPGSTTWTVVDADAEGFKVLQTVTVGG